MNRSGTQWEPQGLGDYIASYADIAYDAVNHKIDYNAATTTQGTITDPEGRLAPHELAPWNSGPELLSAVFDCMRDTAFPENGPEAPPRMPCRLHVEETGHELSIINSEAAVHYFDIDTVYKPAKRIIDVALARPSCGAAVSSLLRRRGVRTTFPRTTHGEVVFSPHSRAISVPAHMPRGHKRKRSSSISSGELGDRAPHVMPSGGYAGDSDMQSEGEGQATVDRLTPGHENNVEEAHADSSIRIKTGPGDYYCSFVPRGLRSALSTRLLMVGEAKAPHKLTRHMIQGALGNEVTIKTKKFIEAVGSADALPLTSSFATASSSDDRDRDPNDQRWLAAVVTQLYSTLVGEKARYGYITTGQSYILVRIRPNQPTVVDYFFLPALLHQPTLGPSAPQSSRPWLATTPLARLVCLSLLSLFGDGRLTDEEVTQLNANKTAMIWRDPRHREQSLDTKSFLSSAPSRQARDSDPDWTDTQDAQDGYSSNSGAIVASPGKNTQPIPSEPSRKRAHPDTSCNEDARPHRKRRLETPPTAFGTEPHLPIAVTLTPPPDSPQVQDREKGRDSSLPKHDVAFDSHDRVDIHLVPFCTHRCVQMILQTDDAESGAAGDMSCPNWTTHQRHPRPRSRSQLHTLVRSSVVLPRYLHNPSNTEEDPPVLHSNPTTSAIYTGQHGATAAVFKVRIDPGGYILVAKAAKSRQMLRCLEREESAYKRLHSLQGSSIPVCLGLVRFSGGQDGPLLRCFPAALLLSWAGSSLLSLRGKAIDFQRLRSDANKALGQVHSLGILHTDAELRNVLVMEHTNNGFHVALVDFERAVSQRGLARRLGSVANNSKLTFRHACDKERKTFLRTLDNWAKTDIVA